MDLFRVPPDVHTRWSSFENPTAGKGVGAMANRGRKGAPARAVEPGETVTLLDIDGPGVVRRIWMTLSHRLPVMLRSMRIDMYWDGEQTPAVSTPAGDFFGIGLGHTTAFECEFFSNPERRSFVCTMPMPFHRHARITFTNESTQRCDHLFYDVNLTLEPLPSDALYLHAHFRRERPTILGQDFELLPRVAGRGRFLGTNFGVIESPICAGTWWGEGEVKGFIDGDTDDGNGRGATLVGTGSEDYIATGWGQGPYAQRFHGAPLCDKERGRWAMYRYHVPDPVYFQHDCRITYQQIGGSGAHAVREIIARGAVIEPVTINGVAMFEGSSPPRLEDAPDNAWVNFLRSDDVSAVAYFYLDRSTNELPPLPPLAERVVGLEDVENSQRADT